MGEMLKVDLIKTDGGTQTRSYIDPNVVSEYAEAMAAGARFPEITVYHDGENYWLSDGFHRLAAVKENEQEEIAAIVLQGTQADAQWDSYAANATHGLRRTNWDKQRCVEAALRHPKGTEMSDRALAEHCGVDHKTVGAVRKRLESVGEVPQATTRTTSDGRQMDVTSLQTRHETADEESPCAWPTQTKREWPECNDAGVYEANPDQAWKETFKKGTAEITVLQVAPNDWAWGFGVSTAAGGHMEPMTSYNSGNNEEAAKSNAAVRLILWCRDRIAREDTTRAESTQLKHFAGWAAGVAAMSEEEVEAAAQAIKAKRLKVVHENFTSLLWYLSDLNGRREEEFWPLLPEALPNLDWEDVPSELSSWELIEKAIKQVQGDLAKLLPMVRKAKKEAAANAA